MKKIICVLVMFLLSVNIYGQLKHKINLPKVKEEIKLSSLTPFFSIYVDKKENVYLENEPIELSDLAKMLMYYRSKIKEEYIPRTRVFLYIDNNVKYEVIDKIKTEAASIRLYNIIYKTNSIEDKDILKGIFFRNHFSFFQFNGIQKLITKKQEEKNKRFSDSLSKISKSNGIGMFPPPPPPPPLNWRGEFMERLYSDQQDVIDEILNERKCTCITVSNKGIIVNNEVLRLNDFNSIEKLFNENDVLIVNFNKDLKYGDYFNLIRTVKEIGKNKNSTLWAELSSEIREIHNKSEVKICN